MHRTSTPHESGTTMTTDPREAGAIEPGTGPGEAPTSQQTDEAGRQTQAEGEAGNADLDALDDLDDDEVGE